MAWKFSLNRKDKKIAHIDKPKLYRTLFVSPQLELFELDDSQW
jgi:hypothetical protein